METAHSIMFTAFDDITRLDSVIGYLTELKNQSVELSIKTIEDQIQLLSNKHLVKIKINNNTIYIKSINVKDSNQYETLTLIIKKMIKFHTDYFDKQSKVNKTLFNKIWEPTNINE